VSARAPERPAAPPLIVHVLHRFATGGLENGVVNLINHLPAERFRHAVLAVTDIDPAFAARLVRPDVILHALHKPPGHALPLYRQAWQLFRQWRPAVVHSRNLAALEFQTVALAAGVRCRVHGEHGRDVEDLDGTSPRMRWIRRLYSPFVQRYVTVSRDLERYLVDGVGIAARRVEQIYNGVDTERFHPAREATPTIAGSPFNGGGHWLVGTVGRLQTVKNQPLLVDAFVRAGELHPPLASGARLVIAGDGPLRAQIESRIQAAGAASRIWLAGERADTPAVMRGLHLFVLPSQAEGISNTILEAMASGLPVVATAVGGNVELVEPGSTGELVPPGDVDALAAAIVRAFVSRAEFAARGRQARQVALARYSLASMMSRYAGVYDAALGRHRVPDVAAPR
jgi:sugar transferase (PEP-CTERM/EpsH1 system associated)